MSLLLLLGSEQLQTAHRACRGRHSSADACWGLKALVPALFSVVVDDKSADSFSLWLLKRNQMVFDPRMETN